MTMDGSPLCGSVKAADPPTGTLAALPTAVPLGVPEPTAGVVVVDLVVDVGPLLNRWVPPVDAGVPPMARPRPAAAPPSTAATPATAAVMAPTETTERRDTPGAVAALVSGDRIAA